MDSPFEHDIPCRTKGRRSGPRSATMRSPIARNGASMKHVLRGVIGGIFVFCGLVAQAQFSGNIQGDVHDSSGAAVAGAFVTLNNVATTVNWEAKTDAAGNY